MSGRALYPRILKTGKMSKPHISVVDVYEVATDMGKELERIMDLYGAEAVTNLMPKVINSLEMLESFATLNEEENSQIEDLRAKVAKLESEKIGRAEDRLKYEKVDCIPFLNGVAHFLAV